jgi:hypothetical protein
MSWAVVVPSNRPDRLADFQTRWWELFTEHDIDLIVVRDEPATWQSMPWFIPQRSDMIRSLGFIEAYKRDADYVLTLDDDTSPIDDPFAAYERVFEAGAPLSDYLSVGALTTSGLEMRGFPYKDRKPATVAVQYGGWDGVLDYDAATQLAAPRGSELFKPVILPVPRGVPVTGCIMNCAFRREATPIMWQLPLVAGRYNRWGDIWSCLIAKRVLDAVGQVMVINGHASVIHDRASDPITNLEREQPGVRANEDLWEALPWPWSDDLVEAYVDVTDGFALAMKPDTEYVAEFKASRDAWLEALDVV